jgi:hypothetical protein
MKGNAGGWTSVEKRRPRKHRKLLVTNNIAARDAFGQMSHIWIINLLQHDRATGWSAYADNGDFLRIENISHWRYLDEALK